MTQPYATLDGHPLTRCTVHVPPRGPWWADVIFEGAPDASGQVTIVLGELRLTGTVDASHGGTHGLERRARVIAGGGGWATLLPPKSYHNDAGIKRRTVIEDAAREAGETLAANAIPLLEERIGIDYVRQSGPASRALDDVLGEHGWWVGYDGQTRIGERPAEPAEVDPRRVEVLGYEPDDHVVRLGVDDLRDVGIGSLISERLDAPQTVRELRIEVAAEAVQVTAWTGEGERSRIESALRSIARRSVDDRLHGIWRYRVVRMSGDRVELQAVRQRAGLPDVLPVSMWPGLAGAHSQLAGGTECIVQFIEGDRTQPIVTGFIGKLDGAFVPVATTVSVRDTLLLGDDSASEGVPFGDALKSYLDDHCHEYIDSTAGPLVTSAPIAGPATPPTSGVLSASPSPSSKVRVS